MTHIPKFPCPALVLGLTLAGLTSQAQNDPELPTSNNNQVQVVPAPGAVAIDGNDSDWDLSAGIWSYNDPTLVKKYSAWTHLMWDSKGVYLLVRYADLSPLKNTTRGEDFQNSWRADAFQGRVVFDGGTPEEHQMHLNLFYSSTENAPYMIVKHGGFKSQPPYDNTGPDRPDLLAKFGSNMERFGGKIAFRPWDDGKGYNMEAFWPWSYVRTNAQPLKAGDSFAFGIEQMWGSADGTKMIHRLVDNLKDDKVNRIFFFRARDGWGRAVLSDKGQLNVTAEQQKLQATRLKQFINYDTAGPVAIRYSLDSDRDVTIAIDNAAGLRVRNLFGQFPRAEGTNTDFWDGLDDAGNPLPAGDYTARIVDHVPVQVKLVNSVYNAATPPWSTDAGTKLWGSNHGHPTSAAARGDVLLLGFTGTEGSSGMMRVDANGKILWTNTTELLDLTLNDKCAFLISRESWTKKTLIRRLSLATGAIALFENPERSTDITLPVDVSEVKDATIAYAGGKLFGFVPGKDVWRVDPDSGKIEATLSVPGLVALEDQADTLWGLFDDGSVARLDAEGKRLGNAFTAAGLDNPRRLGISQDGKRFAISNRGTNQVLIYDAAGKLIQTLGEAYEAVDGKRPAGKFIETNLIAPLGSAFDSQGRLWLAEAAGTNRRVTCWTADGKLQNQFWGGADYGAMAGFPFATDSTRFIAHGMEFKLDPAPDITHRPSAEKALIFHPELSTTRGWIYAYKGYEYAVSVPGNNKQGYVIIAKRNKAGVFQTVVRITYGEANGKKPHPGSVWTDKNEDGKVDDGETIEGFQGQRHYWSNGWMRPDMTFITPDQLVYRLKEITPTGVPVYDFQNPEKLANRFKSDFRANGSGTAIMDMAGNVSDGVSFAMIDGRTGRYPNPYGRHDAPAARRGLLIAPFRTNGVVENVPGVGSITAIGGDRGEWFLMTMDGLYLSGILQDSKGDVLLDETYIGQESFGGFLWRDEKGRVMAQLGGPSYRIVEILGLETTRKQSLALTLSDAQIAEGVALAQAKAGAVTKEPETLSIAKVAKLPREPASPDTTRKQALIDGAETVRVEEAGDASRWFRVSLAHDGKTLAAMYQVNDANPWKNSEGRFSHAFIGGDAVDLKLDIPGRGPVRLLAAQIGGKDTAVYWQKKSLKPENPLTYVVSNNEANAQNFDVVKRLASAKVQISCGARGYTALITVPLAELGIEPQSGKPAELKGIAGVIFSDPSGTNRASRLYWHDKATGLVSDVPSEARLESSSWGKVILQN